MNIVYWQEGVAWLGYIQDYPDYWTQGETLDDLKAHLRDLYQDLSSGVVPGIRKVEDWEQEIKQRLAEANAGSVPWGQVRTRLGI